MPTTSLMRMLLLGGRREIRRLCPAITPTLGAELLTNGDMETGDPPAGWAPTIGATLAAVADERTGGAGAQSVQIVNATEGASRSAAQPVTLSNGDWARLTGYAKRVTSSCGLRLHATYVGYGATPDTWVALGGVLRATVDAPSVYASNISTGVGSESRADDISCKALTLSSLLVPLGRRSQRSGTYRCLPTVSAGTQAGLAIGYADENNMVLAYVNRADGRAYLTKRIAGTYTDLVSGAITYGAGKELKVIVSSPTTYKLYYDGAQVGTDQTIADAGLGTAVYGFATDSASTPGLVTTSKAVS